MTARAVAVGLADSTVYVLSGGQADERHLDEYSAETCLYRHSSQTPGSFFAMAVDSGRVYLESEELVPHVVILRKR
jgi:hypothetical protein